MTARHAGLAAMLFAALLSCDSPTGSDPVPAQVTAVQGTPQTGTTEDPLAQDLVVEVSDSRGRPVPGVAVAWEVDAGGGTLSAASTVTDGTGRARVQWTLGSAAGSFTARARVQGLPPAAFTATAMWPQPAQLQVVSGDGQDGAPAGLLADSLVVRVVSAKGRPVPQATVAWSVSAGGGTLSAATATTDAQGMARVAWTLGGPGPNAATATVGSLPPAAFAAYAVPVASVTLSSATLRVGRGDAAQLVATPRDSTGAPLEGRTIAWTTSSAVTASVSNVGTVTGRGLGTATVTATSEGKSASAEVTVTTEDRTAPRLESLTYSPGQVDVTDASRTVEFSLRVTDGGSGMDWLVAGFDPPAAGTYGASCAGPAGGNARLASGTAEDGVWTCTATVPRGAPAGVWSIPYIILVDRAGNQASYPGDALAAAGHPIFLTVANTAPPAAPPAITGLAFSPDPVNVGDADAGVEVTFTATAGAGVREATVWVYPTRGIDAGSLTRTCTSTTRAGGTSTSGTWKCSLVIPRHAMGGTWAVSTLPVTDSAGRVVQYTGEQLAAAGITSSFQVVSPHEDATAPALTGLSVSPATLDLSEGAAVVEVTFSATDAGAGVMHASAALWPPSGNGQGCTADAPSGIPAQSVTITCGIVVPTGAAEGDWRLEVYLFDGVGNPRHYTNQQLTDAGFAHQVTVTH